ncbi:MAG TPA: META domain-containing protein [Ktedonobacterales bacterium]
MKRPLIVVAATVAVALVVAVIVLIAQPAGSHAATPATLTGHTWTLTRLVVDGDELILSSDTPITLSVQEQDHSLSGNSGCNTYGASYTLTGDQIHITDLRSTLVFCDDAGVMEREFAYTQALQRVESLHIDGDTLTLEGANGQIFMTFV